MDPLRHNIPRDRDDGGHDINQDILSRTQQDDMVSAPAAPPPSNPTSRDANVAKRYRAAPAKTFQCRGYGDCHMVFSRSEHLARHVRKHTGERPFTCHCGKQFSRLDNLRQHAQTVHSDKPEDNERMMRELTALHTSMAAAHKAATSRGKRSQQSLATPASAAANASQAASLGMGSSSVNNGVKVEEMQMHRTLSSANYYEHLGSNSIMQQMQMHHLRRPTLELDPTMHRNNSNCSPDSTSSSSSAYRLPPTPPITPPTAIPFVTPTSPFVTHNPARSSNTNNSNSNNPASPFLPPSPFSPPPPSSHTAARHHLAVGHPLQAVPTQAQQQQFQHHQHQQSQQHPMFAPHSRQSLPLSPNPSPHPAGSLPFFSYPPAQQAQTHGDREQHRQPTHISPTGHLSAADDLQLGALQVEGWALSQSFPYTEQQQQQSWEDLQQQHQGQRTSSPAASENMLTQQHTGTHRARLTGMARAQTTVPFPSTLPRSPTPGQAQQRQQHLAFASGHTAATTGPSPTMTSTATSTSGMMPPQAAAQRPGRHPHPQPPPGSAASTTTAGPEAGLSLDGSPSWSSAMTPTLQGPLFYHYQAAQDQQRHLAGSNSHPQAQQQPLQSRQQQQQYLQGQQHQQQQHSQQQQQQLQQQQQGAEARQADLQSGAPSHMASMGLGEDYIQRYVAMAQAAAQQQGFYLSAPAPGNANNNSALPPPHAHQARFRSDGEVQHQGVGPGAAHHPPTPTSALTPATAYSSPPAMTKYESPSLHAGALQLLPE